MKRMFPKGHPLFCLGSIKKSEGLENQIILLRRIQLSSVDENKNVMRIP